MKRLRQHVSWFVKVRLNVTKRLKARQMCVVDDDEHAISKKNHSLNCTGHPIMHRTANTNLAPAFSPSVTRG